MQNEYICPLTGESKDIELVEIISTDDIVKLYKKYRNLDLTNEFKTKEIHLLKNKSINFYFFHPFVSGTSNFYEALTSKPQYASEKDEYLFASKYIKDTDKVLDVGCGWGWFRSYIPNTNYLGIEFSKQSLQKCKEKNINVTSVLIQDMAKKEEKFDVVVAFQVIEHIEDPLNFIQSMVDSAVSKGLIIISVPNVDNFMGVMENNYLNLPPHHVSMWSKQSLLYIAQKLNLEVIDIEIEKSKTLAPLFSILLKQKFNRFFNRKTTLIRNNFFDRFLNRIFASFAKFFPTPTRQLSIGGHSITIVLKKRN
jgi:2-polyprenyl-3-methyl-5-hydroxy-6-metoxy-1,4-benzoquinol methylase